MAWALDSGRPIYLQLQQELEVRIVTGIYPPGSQLPGVRTLAQEAAVNPNTMQKSLQELERQGLVFAQRTSGRYVTEDEALIQHLRDRLALQQASEFLDGMKKLGLTASEAEDYLKRAENEREEQL